MNIVKFNKGDTVVIKGYKKRHKITGIFTISPTNGKSFICYHLSETPSNKRYLTDDLIKK